MSIADEAEEYLRAVTAQPEPPRPSECLRCYVRRMVARNGCDGGHRWVKLWVRHRPGSRPDLLRWLEDHDGLCDCEVVMNVFRDEIPAATDQLPPHCPSSVEPAADP